MPSLTDIFTAIMLNKAHTTTRQFTPPLIDAYYGEWQYNHKKTFLNINLMVIFASLADVRLQVHLP